MMMVPIADSWRVGAPVVGRMRWNSINGSRLDINMAFAINRRGGEWAHD